jgi:SAM-dependent methyltransferase
VLDLGCGTGRHLVHLAGRGYGVTGVDMSAEMLRLAAKKLDRCGLSARLVRGDICSLSDVTRADEGGAPALPIEEGAFDAAVCMFSTIGLVRTRRLRKRAVAGWRRLLRPGGVLAVHTHNLWHCLAEPGGGEWLAWHLATSLLPGRELGDKYVASYRGMERLFLHLFRRGELRQLLEGAGLETVREVLLNHPRTGPVEGDAGVWRRLTANGFLVAARRANPD